MTTPKTPDQNPEAVLNRLSELIAARRGQDVNQSYVARLLSAAPDAALKKVGEEAAEVILAGKEGNAQALVSEMADLWFHCLVALAQAGLGPEQVLRELARREGLSGLDEKAARKAQQRADEGRA